MISSIKTNLYKVLLSKEFYICSAFTVILCFSANIYTDIEKNDRYSVFTALRTIDREFMLTDISFCSFNVIQHAIGGWFSMFIPIVAAYPFIPLVCDEFETKSIRYEIFRTNRIVYYISRFFTACICGGLAVVLGYAFFSVLAFTLFPSFSDYDSAQCELLLETTGYSYIDFENVLRIPVLKTFGIVFLYGFVMAVPSIALTAVIRNKYLVLCIPFFLKYAVGQTCIKLQSQALSDIENTNEKLLKITSIISPDSLANLYHTGDIKNEILLYNICVVLVTLIVYVIIQLRRFDSGE